MSVTVSTADMCALSGRLAGGGVMADDLDLASRLITELVRRLPADSTLKFIQGWASSASACISER